MYFNSFEFIFLFLPIALLVFIIINKSRFNHYNLYWLITVSLFFYGWWNIKYLLLILFSIFINFIFGKLIRKLYSKIILVISISANLLILGYYKYFNFFLDSLNSFSDYNFAIESIILPLGISFFTFQQITFLVDSYLGKVKEDKFSNYFLFVIFFPQLIAGPIVHHSEMMPQFKNNFKKNINLDNLTAGIITFIIGLFKKIVIADNIAKYSDPIFFAAESGIALTFFDAWVGTLSFMLQLYFDFSGYTDMALGIGLMFGIKLPNNFLSPFKATNISEFWRCWHITLTRMIRNYIYTPLALKLTRMSIEKNLGEKITFFMGVIFPTLFAFFWVGVWHGAGWNFIYFGLLNGFYLIIYYLVQQSNISLIRLENFNIELIRFLKMSFNFILVSVSFIFFRAKDLASTKEIFKGITGLNGINLGDAFKIGEFATEPIFGLFFIISLILFVFYLPNTKSIIEKQIINIDLKTFMTRQKNYQFKLYGSFKWGIIFGLMLMISISLISNTNEFLYFEF